MRILLYIYLILCISNIYYGQERYVANHSFYELADGLQNRIINQITLDNEQFYWLRLPVGIQIFDGQEFIDYLDFPKQDYIQNIFSDSTGTYLSCSDFCVLYYENYRDAPTKIDLQKDRIKGEPYAISSNEDAHNYFVTKDNNWHYFYKNFRSPQLIDSIYSEFPFYKWVVLDDEISWISDDDLFYSKQKKGIVKYGDQLASCEYRYVSIMKVLDHKVVFSFAEKQGVYEMDGDGQIQKLFPNYNLTFVSEDQYKNTLWGLSDWEARFITKLVMIDSEKVSYNYNELLDLKNTILDCYSFDFSETILFGSYNGLYHAKFRSEGIEGIYVRPGVKPSNFGNVIMDVAVDKEDNVYMVREGGTIMKYTMGNDIVSIAEENTKALLYGLNNIKYDSLENCLWLSSANNDRNSSLIKYDLSNKEFTYFSIPFFVNNISLFDDNMLVLSGMIDNRDGVLMNYDWATKTVLYEEKFENQIIYDVKKIGNYLWLATNDGLFKRDELTSNETNLGQYVNARYIQEVDSLVFVSSHGSGMYVIFPDGDHITLNKENCLENNFVAGVEKDVFGNYWVSTFNGISVLNSDFESIEYLNTEDGVSSNEFNTGALAQRDQNLYFGSINGLSKINPKEVLKESNRDLRFRSNILYFQNKVTSNLILQESGNEIIGLPDSIFITVKSISPGKEKKSLSKLYDVQLEDLDASISFDGNIIKILSPRAGAYNVNLISRKNSSIIPLTRFSIKRDRRLLLRSILLVIGFSLLSFLLSNHLIKLNRKKEEEKTALNKRISEVQLEAIRSQMNPHFIFNSLGAIQYYIMSSEKKLAGKYLSKFAKLMRMFLESSKSKEVTLDHVINQLTLYLELEKLRFEDKFDYLIHVSPDILTIDERIPSMLLQPYVENSILHGLNHKLEGQGLIEINFNKYDDYLMCEIDDNGIGRAKANEIMDKKKLQHKSRATQMISERIELLKMSGEAKIEVNYIDKLDGEGVPLGTKVILKFYSN